ncbi:hypothetical protein EUGRSUZ_H04611 [Eucalyptus grandis]|uniref:Uncharacterized protein n=2 Tax=Eucalyptus grandis TaxID=71139 RepID=A0ACC3JX62_EUCGR|nr:hypothetical protein EUGRSUZ_H04611 [Eucalyptus grandis]
MKKQEDFLMMASFDYAFGLQRLHKREFTGDHVGEDLAVLEGEDGGEGEDGRRQELQDGEDVPAGGAAARGVRSRSRRGGGGGRRRVDFALVLYLHLCSGGGVSERGKS